MTHKAEEIGCLYSHCAADIQLSKNAFLRSFNRCSLSSGKEVPGLVESFLQTVDDRLSQMQRELLATTMPKERKTFKISEIVSDSKVERPLINWYQVSRNLASLRFFLIDIQRLLLQIQYVILTQVNLTPNQRHDRYLDIHHKLLCLENIRYRLPISVDEHVRYLYHNKFCLPVVALASRNFLDAFHFLLFIEPCLLEFWDFNEFCNYRFCSKLQQATNEKDFVRHTKSMRTLVPVLTKLLGFQSIKKVF